MLYLTPIDKKIQDELKARMKGFDRATPAAGESQSEVKYSIADLNSRTPWIKMTSAIPNDGNFISIGDNNSSGYKNVYAPIGNPKPIAGIKNITVEYSGGLKALRNATISWTCWSFEDLDKYTPYFFSVGKTV